MADQQQTQVQGVDWQRIGAALREPFPAECVDWRPQGKTTPGGRVQLLPYVDARAVQFGVGRYLYDIPAVWVTLDAQGNVPDAMRAKLAEALRRRDHQLARGA